MSTKMMHALEAKLGYRMELVDDWNALGFQFHTIPMFNTRVLILTNYTEAKAEGGSVAITVSEVYNDRCEVDPLKVDVTIFASDGSGPHGIAWYDELLHFRYGTKCQPPHGSKLPLSMDQFADALMEMMIAEGQSEYWKPVRDNEWMPELLFEFQQSENSPVEQKLIPWPWKGQDLAEANRPE